MEKYVCFISKDKKAPPISVFVTDSHGLVILVNVNISKILFKFPQYLTYVLFFEGLSA